MKFRVLAKRKIIIIVYGKAKSAVPQQHHLLVCVSPWED